MHSLPEPHIVFDPDYRIVAANAAYERDYDKGQAGVRRRCYQVSHHTDLRIVAAMMAQGGFREDLDYRLSVVPQRRLRLSAPAMTLLERQHFRGNVRELRNLLERSALLCDGQTLEANHIALALSTGCGEHERLPSASHARAQLTSRLLATHPGSRAELAAQLGMSEHTLYRKLKALG